MDTQGSFTSAVIGTSSAQLLGAAPTRKCVILSPPAAGRVSISSGTTAVLDAGITLTAGMQPIILNVDYAGAWIQGVISAIADAASRTVGIVEVLGNPAQH